MKFGRLPGAFRGFYGSMREGKRAHAQPLLVVLHRAGKAGSCQSPIRPRLEIYAHVLKKMTWHDVIALRPNGQAIHRLVQGQSQLHSRCRLYEAWRREARRRSRASNA